MWLLNATGSTSISTFKQQSNSISAATRQNNNSNDSNNNAGSKQPQENYFSCADD